MNREIQFRYTKSTAKFFKLHEDVKAEFVEAFRELLIGEHPESVDYKRLKGKFSRYYRLRLGEYRVVFTYIDGQIVIVEVILAGSRGDIYKKLKGKP